MKEGSREPDASEREADSFELQLHQKLGSKHAKVGWGFMLVAFMFTMAPFVPLVTTALLHPATLESVHVELGTSSFFLILIPGAIGASFLRKAFTHRDRAEEIERRIRKARGSGESPVGAEVPSDERVTT